MRGLRLGVATVGISLLAAAPVLAQEVQSPSHAEIAAAETNLNISLGFMHTNYSEGPLDSEDGFAPGFGVGASALLPSAFQNIDLYSALFYQFNAGNLNYTGHEENLLTQAVTPIKATDRAVFNHIEGRLGLGFPLADGQVEIIPYITAGYMAWNRNIDNRGAIGTDEFYRTALVGVGAKLDTTVTPSLVFSASAQFSGLVASNITFNTFNEGHTLGDSGDERVSLGLDQHVSGPLHVFATATVEHFNYAGDKFNDNNIIFAGPYAYQIAEPTSSTTQVGVNLGVSYSF
jgi:hypothetical protein